MIIPLLDLRFIFSISYTHNQSFITHMKITESASKFDNLENMSVRELLENMNKEDNTVPAAVGKLIPKIEKLVEAVVKRMRQGGRLFYIGAGTSGRLGILDASECPPTFGVPHDMVIGLIAGGDTAIRKAVEFAEDDLNQAWIDLQDYEIHDKDTVVGIAASGTTPYVIGGVKAARSRGILTACITCNPDSPLSKEVEIPIEVIVGPEFVTGSTRMKAGTAQKLTLNMISTSIMIRMGRVKGNKMVDMQLSNNKLVDRGTRMVMDELFIGKEEAEKLLKLHGSVRKVIENNKKDA
ncbi:N-acetylmuramic acid 6-phosphate etherase [soil metagenome]